MWIVSINGVYASEDRGETWTWMAQGNENFVAKSLAVSGSTLFLGTYGSGVWKAPVDWMSTAARSVRASAWTGSGPMPGRHFDLLGRPGKGGFSSPSVRSRR